MTTETVSLREHFDALLAERDKAVQAALNANDRRLDALNEFRGQLEDERGTYATKELLDAKAEALDSRLRVVEQGGVKNATQIGVIMAWAGGGAGLGVAGAALAGLLK